MVSYIQSPQGWSRGWLLCSLGAGVWIEYRIAVKSPNLIIGLGSCALQMKNLNVHNIKQSTQIFSFTSDILNLRNGLTLLLK